MKKIMSWLIVNLLVSNLAFAGYVATPYSTSDGGTGVSSQSNSVAVTTDSSGHIVSTSSTTATEIGYVHGLTSAIQTQLNGKQATLTIGNFTDAGTDGITVTSGTGAVIGSGTSIAQHVADTSHAGYLSASDWNSFTGKQAALSFGNLTDAGTDGITVTGGTGAVIGSGSSISQHVADASHSGYLSSTVYNLLIALVTPSIADIADSNYSIQSSDNIVRTTTTLTAARAPTLPACTAGNIGEKHIIKNTPAQTYNVTVTAAGSDLIDGAATIVLLPGDSQTVSCDYFSTVGTWDLI